jgi:hypothetical protein
VEEDEGDKQMPESGKGLFDSFSMWKDFVLLLRSWSAKHSEER